MDLERVKKLDIPRSPGCYFFLDGEGNILYIGKAADLRSRVLSYWQKGTDHTPAKYSMLKRVHRIDWTETDSEIEALLLEANLIKRYQPPYNVALRDDKRYIYIKISEEEEYPRIFMTRSLDQSGRYFGPFTSVEAVKQTLKVIRKIWPYRSCRTMPKRACLYYRIGKCPGPCEGHISPREYRKIIGQITLFLEGKKKKVVEEIEKKLKKLKQQKEKGTGEEEELERRINYYENILTQMDRVLRHTNILSLMDKYASDVVELAKLLQLPRVPERIEGYDISSIFGSQAVGSMVVFTQGEPNKDQYRKFKVKAEQNQKGDTQMLEEVLDRRLSKLEETEKTEKWPRPDLLIIDGGKQQLNTAQRVLKRYSLDIPLISISKGSGMRSSQAPDKIFFPGQSTPLQLPLNSPALHIVKRVRDEAHRFAIEYHKKLRKKKYIN